MNRISENYTATGVLKEDLLAEIEARIKEGSPNFSNVTPATLKDDLVAALELDDEHKDSKPDKTPEAVSGGTAVEIPTVKLEELSHIVCPPPPSDDKFTIHAKRVSDGMLFAVAFHEPDTYGKTVTAKNSALFWQGDEATFRLMFDKV